MLFFDVFFTVFRSFFRCTPRRGSIVLFFGLFCYFFGFFPLPPPPPPGNLSADALDLIRGIISIKYVLVYDLL